VSGLYVRTAFRPRSYCRIMRERDFGFSVTGDVGATATDRSRPALPGAAAPIRHSITAFFHRPGRVRLYVSNAFSNGDARRSAAKRFNFAWPAAINARP